MTWHGWIGFVAASALMGAIPGPGVASIVAYAITGGRRIALASVAGMALGNAVAMTLSLAGVGVLLAASAAAFTLVKWAGAAYLITLGLLTLARSSPAAGGPDRAGVPLRVRTAFLGNVGIGTFHPKTIIFFVAFVPQFISAEGEYARQAALLVATFCIVVAGTDAAYALAAARAARMLRGPRVGRWSKRLGGGVLIASGVATAAARP